MAHDAPIGALAGLNDLARQVVDGARDPLIHEMTSALERAYRDVPGDPIATILLPAYRTRCQMLGRHGR
jgi:hypothetical protein